MNITSPRHNSHLRPPPGIGEATRAVIREATAVAEGEAAPPAVAATTVGRVSQARETRGPPWHTPRLPFPATADAAAAGLASQAAA